MASAFWRMTLIDAAIFREWVANVGSRQAYSRVSHLLCEMVVRFGAVGLTNSYSCDLPITQTELADATGLSTVHVNRTLQTLRRKKLIRWKDSKLEVLDWQGLGKLATSTLRICTLENRHRSTVPITNDNAQRPHLLPLPSWSPSCGV